MTDDQAMVTSCLALMLKAAGGEVRFHRRDFDEVFMGLIMERQEGEELVLSYQPALLDS